MDTTGSVRSGLLECLRDSGVRDAIIGALLQEIENGKCKTADALKLFDLAVRLQEEETSRAPPSSDNAEFDMSRYSDDELRAMLSAIEQEIGHG